MVKAEVIKLYSISSHVKYNLLYIFTFSHVKRYIFFFQIYIIFNKYFPCIYYFLYNTQLDVTSEHITGIMGIGV